MNESKFSRYSEAVEGKVKLILKDDDNKVVDTFELLAKNSEKMLILNYFGISRQATQSIELLAPENTDTLEQTMFTIFQRSYPKENPTNIRKMIDEYFIHLLPAFMISFGWTNEELLEQAVKEMNKEMTGRSKKKDTRQKN